MGWNKQGEALLLERTHITKRGFRRSEQNMGQELRFKVGVTIKMLVSVHHVGS